MTTNGDTPAISVIIPTHNRCASLKRLLDALCTQTYPLRRMEVVVVADACNDGTVEMLYQYSAPFTLRLIEQGARSAAIARNQGATSAKGQLLLFLDDDMEPTPYLLAAHVRTYTGGLGRVVIGYSQPVLEGRTGFFGLALWGWWEAMFSTMRQPGHRYTYRDVLSGNLCIDAELFADVGGFDPAFPGGCHEDYELGARLLKAGARLTFAQEAVSYHHEKSDLNKLLYRKRLEGQAGVLIGRRHPHLVSTLPLAKFEVHYGLWNRLLRTLAFTRPTAGDILAARFQNALDLFERARMRGYWKKVLGGLCDYWYWRGVAEKLNTRQALASFVQGCPARADAEGTEIEIDLSDGLEAAERRLDAERPGGVRIRYQQQIVGRIPPQAGAEPLRGGHLRPVLATDLAWPLLKALALEGANGRGQENSLFANWKVWAMSDSSLCGRK